VIYSLEYIDEEYYYVNSRFSKYSILSRHVFNFISVSVICYVTSSSAGIEVYNLCMRYIKVGRRLRVFTSLNFLSISLFVSRTFVFPSIKGDR
jgi:hypothetical protein